MARAGARLGPVVSGLGLLVTSVSRKVGTNKKGHHPFWMTAPVSCARFGLPSSSGFVVRNEDDDADDTDHDRGGDRAHARAKRLGPERRAG